MSPHLIGTTQKALGNWGYRERFFHHHRAASLEPPGFLGRIVRIWMLPLRKMFRVQARADRGHVTNVSHRYAYHTPGRLEGQGT